MSTLRIATRKSPLALWQAEHIAAQLRAAHPDLQVTLLPLTTEGDVRLDSPLAQIGGKGLFIKELERAMLAGEADLAVHSMKDVPARLPEGFAIAAVTSREDPRDAFVSNAFAAFDELPQGARVGTCSLRRQAQLLAGRPDLRVLPLRGNVNTRLAKLDAGDYDAIVLACAGLRRLGLDERIREPIDPRRSLPAIGQGVMGIECRAGDDDTHERVQAIADGDAALCIEAERAFGRRLAANCQAPVAGHARLSGAGELHLQGLVAHPDGSPLIAEAIEGPASDASALGEALAERVLGRGAAAILAAL